MKNKLLNKKYWIIGATSTILIGSVAGITIAIVKNSNNNDQLINEADVNKDVVIFNPKNLPLKVESILENYYLKLKMKAFNAENMFLLSLQSKDFKNNQRISFSELKKYIIKSTETVSLNKDKYVVIFTKKISNLNNNTLNNTLLSIYNSSQSIGNINNNQILRNNQPLDNQTFEIVGQEFIKIKKESINNAEVAKITSFLNQEILKITHSGQSFEIPSRERSGLSLELTIQELNELKSFNDLKPYIVKAIKNRLQGNLSQYYFKNDQKILDYIQQIDYNAIIFKNILLNSSEVLNIQAAFDNFIKHQKALWDDKGSVTDFEKYNNLMFDLNFYGFETQFKSRIIIKSPKSSLSISQKLGNKSRKGIWIRKSWIQSNEIDYKTLKLMFNQPFGKLEDMYNNADFSNPSLDFSLIEFDNHQAINEFKEKLKVFLENNHKNVWLNERAENLTDKNADSQIINLNNNFKIIFKQTHISSQTGILWDGIISSKDMKGILITFY